MVIFSCISHRVLDVRKYHMNGIKRSLLIKQNKLLYVRKLVHVKMPPRTKCAKIEQRKNIYVWGLPLITYAFFPDFQTPPPPLLHTVCILMTPPPLLRTYGKNMRPPPYFPVFFFHSNLNESSVLHALKIVPINM